MTNCLNQAGEAQVYMVPAVGGSCPWSLGPGTLGLSWQEHEVEEVAGSDWGNIMIQISSHYTPLYLPMAA